MRLTEKELYNGEVTFTKCQHTNCPDKCSQCEIPKEAELKLKEYEDAEEQGLLLRLPVAIGSEVWKIINQRDNFTDIPYKIVTIVHFRLDMLKEIGKTVFLTKEEAEQVRDNMPIE